MPVCFQELTIDELLDDGMTQRLMSADGVNRSALRNMLDDLAASIQQQDREAGAGFTSSGRHGADAIQASH